MKPKYSKIAGKMKSESGSNSASLNSKGSSSISDSSKDFLSAIKITYENYFNGLKNNPKLMLIDSFLIFLVLLGVLQFAFAILLGNFPFNAFLAGFIAAVGQFVLTCSLRLQWVNSLNEKSISDDSQEKEDSEDKVIISGERSIGDYVFASLILHFVVYHFIN